MHFVGSIAFLALRKQRRGERTPKAPCCCDMGALTNGQSSGPRATCEIDESRPVPRILRQLDARRKVTRPVLINEKAFPKGFGSLLATNMQFSVRMQATQYLHSQEMKNR